MFHIELFWVWQCWSWL